MSKKALITGVTGQDGAYLARFLLEKGYHVFGGYRRVSTPNFWRLHYLEVLDQIDLLPLDLIDASSVLDIVKKTEPDEIYHLAAQSFVEASFDQPIATAQITALGTLRILDVIRLINPKIKFYQASSSEMFGNNPQSPQSEKTPFHPDSPYAIAKSYAHSITGNYRDGYKIFACSGILFNHESPLRGIEFVTKKISDGVAKIKLNLSDELHMGNINSKRDWGFAGDYVKAMWLMLQQDEADDYVVATGESHSVQEFLEEAFAYVDLDYKKYVKIDKKFFRPKDVSELLGDPTKAKEKLGWRLDVSFKDLVHLMVDADLEKYQNPDKFNGYFLNHV